MTDTIYSANADHRNNDYTIAFLDGHLDKRLYNLYMSANKADKETLAYADAHGFERVDDTYKGKVYSYYKVSERLQKFIDYIKQNNPIYSRYYFEETDISQQSYVHFGNEVVDGFVLPTVSMVYCYNLDKNAGWSEDTASFYVNGFDHAEVNECEELDKVLPWYIRDGLAKLAKKTKSCYNDEFALINNYIRRYIQVEVVFHFDGSVTYNLLRKGDLDDTASMIKAFIKYIEQHH